MGAEIAPAASHDILYCSTWHDIASKPEYDLKKTRDTRGRHWFSGYLTWALPAAKPCYQLRKMGKLSMKFLATTLLVLLFIATANAQTGPGSLVCKVKVTELAQCLPAITGNSPPKPTVGCCKVLKKANLQCLCKRKADLSKFGANPGKALALLKQCDLPVPQQCKKKH